MISIKKAYDALNAKQRQAVDTIDGPLLVIAGPGTGKTQLLSVRVANILNQTDTPPQTILCLTFTESGAANMRSRLTNLIGSAAYGVTVSTYHAFGGDLIQRYPEFFSVERELRPIDDLTKRQILNDLLDELNYRNPLKQTQHHLRDVISTISELKRALLTSHEIKAIAHENILFIQHVNPDVQTLFIGFSRMPSSAAQAIPLFTSLREVIHNSIPEQPVNQEYGTLADQLLTSLDTALDLATQSKKSGPLTKWKNDWLQKNSANEFGIAGELSARRFSAMGDLLEAYAAVLQKRGLYDFDDMILQAITALENNDELRFNVQEQYQYVLLDEFQDTNAAQLKLVALLTNNPVHEGRPNVMAVGDDDQAIYAFQGADYSNMRQFFSMYRDTAVIDLIDNYRSQPDILTIAGKIAGQISNRLSTSFGIEKVLHPAIATSPASRLERIEYQSDIAQYADVADRIEQLITQGVNAESIAVLAPRHKQLAPLVPYLLQRPTPIPVYYEKREDILKAPIVRQVLTMARLVIALHEGKHGLADQLWPEVLSFNFWHHDIQVIWQSAWAISDARRVRSISWAEYLLETPSVLKPAAIFFLGLAGQAAQLSCDEMLDFLCGNALLETGNTEYPTVSSPLRAFYTDQTADISYYDGISELTVLRTKLREHLEISTESPTITDLLTFVDLYIAANEPFTNTSPYGQSSHAVQLMTVFKAKGLEFEYVFLVNCQNDVWGSSTRSSGNHITLPANLLPIRYAGTTDDERLRILYVAITRAKIGLYLLNYRTTYSGKPTRRLQYFEEQETSDGEVVSRVLPSGHQAVIINDIVPPSQAALEHNWHETHVKPSSELHGMLGERIESYQLSPTHLNTFCDMIYGGPQRFFISTLLRFPEAPSVSAQFGNAIHETLDWLQRYYLRNSKLASLDETTHYFNAQIARKQLTLNERRVLNERGSYALTQFLKTRSNLFMMIAQSEYNFSNEGVFVGDAHLSGKVDRLEIDAATKTITVVDYKTGTPYSRWKSDPKLHKYRQQLYCYKLLIEGSERFKGYRVPTGRLEFIEPDDEGNVHQLELTFEEDELIHVKQLIEGMWYHVMECNFPNTSHYDPSLSGIHKFEQDLLDGTI